MYQTGEYSRSHEGPRAESPLLMPSKSTSSPITDLTISSKQLSFHDVVNTPWTGNNDSNYKFGNVSVGSASPGVENVDNRKDTSDDSFIDFESDGAGNISVSRRPRRIIIDDDEDEVSGSDEAGERAVEADQGPHEKDDHCQSQNESGQNENQKSVVVTAESENQITLQLANQGAVKPKRKPKPKSKSKSKANKIRADWKHKIQRDKQKDVARAFYSRRYTEEIRVGDRDTRPSEVYRGRSRERSPERSRERSRDRYRSRSRSSERYRDREFDLELERNIAKSKEIQRNIERETARKREVDREIQKALEMDQIRKIERKAQREKVQNEISKKKQLILPPTFVLPPHPLVELNILLSHERRFARKHHVITKINCYNLDNTLLCGPVPNLELVTKEASDMLLTPYGLFDGGWSNDPLLFDIMSRDKGANGSWFSDQCLQSIIQSGNSNSTLTILYSGRIRETTTNETLRLLRTRLHLARSFDAVILRSDSMVSGDVTNAQFIAQSLYKTIQYYRYACEISIHESNPKNIEELERMFKSTKWVGTKKHIARGLVHRIFPSNLTRGNLDPSVERQFINKMVREHNSAVNEGLLHRINRFRGKIALEEVIDGVGSHYKLDEESTACLIDIVEGNCGDLSRLEVHCDKIMIENDFDGVIEDEDDVVYWNATHVGRKGTSMCVLKVEPVNNQENQNNQNGTDRKPRVVVLVKEKDHPELSPSDIADWIPMNPFQIGTKLVIKKKLNMRELK